MPSSKKNVKSKTNVKTNDENSSSIKETPKPVVESVEPSITESSITESSTVVVEDEPNLEFENQYNQLSDVITNLLLQVKEVQSHMRNLHKIHSKEIKLLEKKTKKNQ